jgi:hypothetical protein
VGVGRRTVRRIRHAVDHNREVVERPPASIPAAAPGHATREYLRAPVRSMIPSFQATGV